MSLISEHQQRSHRRVVNQLHFGSQDEHARAFGANKRLRDIEPLIRQQRRKIKPGDAARDHRKFLPNAVRVLIPKLLQATVDLTFTAALGDEAVELLVRRRADSQANSVIGDDVQFIDVVYGLAGHHRVNAAGVVADHASERVPAVGGRVRAER